MQFFKRLREIIASKVRKSLAYGILIFAAVLLFLALYFFLHPVLGDSSFIFSFIPVAVTGAVFGFRAGLGSSLLIIVVDLLLLFLEGETGVLLFFHNGGLAGFVALVMVGAVGGGLGDLWVEQQKELERRAQTETELRKSQERNRELLATAERQSRELVLLDQVHNALVRELDRLVMFRTVVEITAKTFSYKLVSLYRLKDETLLLFHQVGYKKAVEVIPLDQGLMSRCVRSLMPLLVENVHSEPDFLEAGEGVVSELCVPLFEQGRVIGVLNVESGPDVRLGEADLRLMVQVSEYINIALERARLFGNVQNLARQMTLLNEITSRVISATRVEDIYQSLVDQLGKLVDADDTYFTRWNDALRQTLPVAAYGPMQEWYPTFNLEPGEPTLTSRVLDLGRTLLVEDYQNSPYINPRIAALFALKTILVLPLITNQEKLGAVMIGFRRPHIFTPEEVALCEQAVGQVALAITKLLLISRIEQMVITDDLTGLLNPRGLADFGHREVERAIRYNRPLSLLMIDIDRFKKVNDSYGHLVGNRVLQALAERCQSAIRDTDIVGRYGGEEFVVLLPENNLSSALEAAERLRAAIAGLHVPSGLGPAIQITASIGAAEIIPGVEDLETLIGLADRAMYTAKQGGRNRVAVNG
jgi:diguanylate cyclase (GGDEF)-like protein